jgi:hypothetical protein
MSGVSENEFALVLEDDEPPHDATETIASNEA